MPRRARASGASPVPGVALAPLGPLAWVALVWAIAYVLTYVVLAALRLRFPFELEWMEGATLGEVGRVVRGQPLYVPPSLEFTPFIYPPLYFWVSAAVAKVLGLGFPALRLVSIAASLACFALIYLLVRQDGPHRAPAVLAVGLFAACYAQGGAWLDVGRVDSLFLCLLLAAVVALRRIESPWVGGAAGGVLLALSALTKQSALFVAAPVALALLAFDIRRGATFVVSAAVLMGAAAEWLDRASQGWFRFYVFELPRHHPIIPQLVRGFWIEDLLGPLAIALVIGTLHFFTPPVRPRARRLALDLGLAAGLIGAAYATRVRVGSYINVVLPAYLAASLLFGHGLNACMSWRSPAHPAGRPLERLVALLVLLQFALLAYSPARHVPKDRDRVAGRQIVESLKRVQGDVWVPRHTYLAAMAGKPWRAHELALQDVLRPVDTPQHKQLLDEIRAAARERRFAVLVLDDETWIHDEFAPYYTLTAKMFRDDEPDLFWPLTGFVTRPNFVWTPKAEGATPGSQ